MGAGGVFTSSKNSFSATSPSPFKSTSLTNLQTASSSSFEEPSCQMPRISSSAVSVFEPSASRVPNNRRLTVLLSNQGSSSHGSRTPLPSLSRAVKRLILVASEIVAAKSTCSSSAEEPVRVLVNLPTGSLRGFMSFGCLFVGPAGALIALASKPSLLGTASVAFSSCFGGGLCLSCSGLLVPLLLGADAPHPMPAYTAEAQIICPKHRDPL
mmetsp:Transcript_50929/g.94175  ORF Transcript_50929/g.94175 Transcript_50929/m.94175 type:complete len:212 (+) Transcript_50929:1452-2087(+)